MTILEITEHHRFALARAKRYGHCTSGWYYWIGVADKLKLLLSPAAKIYRTVTPAQGDKVGG